MLSGFANENQDNWDKLLKGLAFAYNISVHASTNHTPYELMFGRRPKLPIDLVVPEADPIQQIVSLEQSSFDPTGHLSAPRGN
jgi:hypothetical protein